MTRPSRESWWGELDRAGEEGAADVVAKCRDNHIAITRDHHMNTLASELATVCRDHLLSEKWLIAPSRRVGHQWLDRQ